MTGDSVLCNNWYLLGKGNKHNTTGCGALFKIFDKHPRAFYKGVPCGVTSESILWYFTVFLAHGGGEKEDIFIIV